MKLPSELSAFSEWTLVGPLGPMVPESLLAHPILAVDGGARFTSKQTIWVGDSDSGKPAADCLAAFHFPSVKAESDLALALQLLAPLGPLKLHLWGFLGGRPDHELFNLGEASSFLEAHPGSEVFFYGHSSKVVFKILGKGEWNLHHQGLFSLAAFKNATITLSGKCRYPLPAPTLLTPLSSLGLSNEATGDFVVTTSSPILVIYPEDK